MLRAISAVITIMLAWPVMAAEPQAARSLRIGVLVAHTSPSGEASGDGSVLAARMAIEDFGGKMFGLPVAIVTGDHHNRPSVGTTIARRWLEHGGADVIIDVPNPAVADAVRLAVVKHDGLMILSQTGIRTNMECQSNIISWTFDGALVARGAIAAMRKHDMSSWLLLSPDTYQRANAAGAMLEIMREANVAVDDSHQFTFRNRGPMEEQTGNLAEKLLEHPSAVIALNAGPLATKAVTKRLQQELADRRLPRLYSPLYPVMGDSAPALAAIADELIYALPYQQDSPAVADFTQRFKSRADGRSPNVIQIGVYSAVRHYLRAVALLGSAQPGGQAGAAMQELPIDDPIFGAGTILPDGRRLGALEIMAHHPGITPDRILAHHAYDEKEAQEARARCGKNDAQ